MPVAHPAYFWEAEVEIEVNRLAFTLGFVDVGRGATRKRIFTADWLKDGKVYFNPSRRLAGWFKKNLGLIRTTYREQTSALKVFPVGETWIPIADASELTGSDTPLPEGAELPRGLPTPFKHFFPVEEKGGRRSTAAYWVELHKPIAFKVKIVSFARGITPQVIKEALSKLGSACGIGDRYSQGYGLFKLISFEAKEEKLNL